MRGVFPSSEVERFEWRLRLSSDGLSKFGVQEGTRCLPTGNHLGGIYSWEGWPPLMHAFRRKRAERRRAIV